MTQPLVPGTPRYNIRVNVATLLSTGQLTRSDLRRLATTIRAAHVRGDLLDEDLEVLTLALEIAREGAK